jgi:hypothetical protein
MILADLIDTFNRPELANVWYILLWAFGIMVALLAGSLGIARLWQKWRDRA